MVVGAKVGWSESFSFFDRHCKFWTEGIMCAQNFNFALIFFTWGFQFQILHFGTKVFRQEENFPTIFRSTVQH